MKSCKTWTREDIPTPSIKPMEVSSTGKLNCLKKKKKIYWWIFSKNIDLKSSTYRTCPETLIVQNNQLQLTQESKVGSTHKIYQCDAMFCKAHSKTTTLYHHMLRENFKYFSYTLSEKKYPTSRHRREPSLLKKSKQNN